jgi:hypothetical protein
MLPLENWVRNFRCIKNLKKVVAANQMQATDRDLRPNSLALRGNKGIVISVNRAWCRSECPGELKPSVAGLSLRHLQFSAATCGARRSEGFPLGTSQEYRSRVPTALATDQRWCGMFATRVPDRGASGEAVMLAGVCMRKREQPETRYSPICRHSPGKTLTVTSPPLAVGGVPMSTSEWSGERPNYLAGTSGNACPSVQTALALRAAASRVTRSRSWRTRRS